MHSPGQLLAAAAGTTAATGAARNSGGIASLLPPPLDFFDNMDLLLPDPFGRPLGNSAAAAQQQQQHSAAGMPGDGGQVAAAAAVPVANSGDTTITSSSGEVVGKSIDRCVPGGSTVDAPGELHLSCPCLYCMRPRACRTGGLVSQLALGMAETGGPT